MPGNIKVAVANIEFNINLTTSAKINPCDGRSLSHALIERLLLGTRRHRQKI